jgi:hypothetical protein
MKGRIDAHGKWKGIKEKWISCYINRKSEIGLSNNVRITAEDEWCAEAYMETDYNIISKEDFIKSIKDFVLFQEIRLKNDTNN